MEELKLQIRKTQSTKVEKKTSRNQLTGISSIPTAVKLDKRIKSIIKGLQYLEMELDTKEYPFSSDSFGTSRGDMKYSAHIPQFPFGDLHETFNPYFLLLHLEQHLPSSFRSKLIQTLRPKELKTMNFFGDISWERFPNDTETTSVCYLGLLKTNSVTETEIASLAQSVYDNVNEDGVIHLYYVPKEHTRYNRLDAGSITNVLRFAYALGHESLAKKSEDYVFHWLTSGNYKSGTLYYPSAHTFLYFFSQLAAANCETRAKFINTLRHEFAQINQHDLKYPLDYALNILTGAELGIRDEILINKLISLQTDEGSWPVDALYVANKTQVYFGSKALPTMFAILALMETH